MYENDHQKPLTLKIIIIIIKSKKKKKKTSLVEIEQRLVSGPDTNTRTYSTLSYFFNENALSKFNKRSRNPHVTFYSAVIVIC